MPATLINFSQLSKTWKIAAGGGVTLLAVGGVVTTLLTKNASGVVTRQEYSDGRTSQSGTLLVGSGANKVTIDNQGGITAQGTMTGNHLYAGTMSGAGLSDCDVAGTSKLLWDVTTRRFSCGTDANASQNLFETFAVAGQSDVVADSATDTLTLAAGSNITLTTNAGTDTVTIAAAGGGGGGRITGTGAVSGNKFAVPFFNNASLTNLSGSLLWHINYAAKQMGVNSTTTKAALTVVGSGAFTGTVSGSALNIQGGESYILGNLGIGKSGTPNTKLEVAGTISGALLTLNSGSAGASYITGNLSLGTTGNAGSVKLNVAGTMSGKQLMVTGTEAAPLLTTNITAGTVGIGKNTANASGARLFIENNTSAQKGLVIRPAVASPSGNLQEWQRSDGKTIATLSVTSDNTAGTLVLGNGGLSSNTLTFQASTGGASNGPARINGQDVIGIFPSAGTLFGKTGTDTIYSHAVHIDGSSGNGTVGGEQVLTWAAIKSGGDLTVKGGNGVGNGTGAPKNGGNLYLLGGSASGDAGATAGNIFIAYTRTGTPNRLVAVAGSALAGRFTIHSGSGALKALVVRGSGSQTANLQDWQNSAGTTLSTVYASGAISINSSTYRTPLNVVGTMSGSAVTVSKGGGFVNAAACYLASGAMGHCTTADASNCGCTAN